jgi:catechol 2,3-dioxygenase-like lactoylglutathione lyase family enzyme
MQPRISLITLGVTDLARATAFYRDGLGFPHWLGSGEGVSFFRTGGAILALYPWDKLAEDALVPPAGSGFRGVALAHNVHTRAEVSEALAQAVAAGAKLVKPAQDVFWGGHSGYFADLDGHLWEVAWNPGFPLAADGSITLPTR